MSVLVDTSIWIEYFRLLHKINKLEIVINWSQLIDYQYKCIKNGINGIGIPDLMIAQNAKQKPLQHLFP